MNFYRFHTACVTWYPWKSAKRLAFSSSAPMLTQVSVTMTSQPSTASLGSLV